MTLAPPETDLGRHFLAAKTATCTALKTERRRTTLAATLPDHAVALFTDLVQTVADTLQMYEPDVTYSLARPSQPPEPDPANPTHRRDAVLLRRGEAVLARFVIRQEWPSDVDGLRLVLDHWSLLGHPLAPTGDRTPLPQWLLLADIPGRLQEKPDHGRVSWTSITQHIAREAGHLAGQELAAKEG